MKDRVGIMINSSDIFHHIKNDSNKTAHMNLVCYLLACIMENKIDLVKQDVAGILIGVAR